MPVNRRMARLSDVLSILEGGGVLRFYWNGGSHMLTDAQGFSQRVDGRAYHAFVCDGHKDNFQESQTGNTYDGNLVIEWRKSVVAV